MVRAPSRIEVDLDALAANLDDLRAELAPADLVFVVKGNAYGHGLNVVVPAALRSGQGDFATFSAAEAMKARRLAPGAHIQVMGHFEASDLPTLARAGIEVWVGREGTWQAVRQAAERGVSPLRIHIDVETGMHRTGLWPEDAKRVAQEAAEMPGVEWVGTCTHLAGAEERKQWDRLENQVSVFDGFVDWARSQGMDPGTLHVASSSGGMLREDWRYDAVRVGIAAYGHWPTEAVQQQLEGKIRWRPRPVLSWHSRIWSIQVVPAGESVGYGLSGSTDHDRQIAIVPVGYGDGFARGLWDGGGVLVHGRRCPIVGRVNMNMVQVDITDMVVNEDDPVVIIGNQGDTRIGIRSFAETYDMVNYELMARIGQHLPRIGVRRPRKPAQAADPAQAQSSAWVGPGPRDGPLREPSS